jgi:hypothetical protein
MKIQMSELCDIESMGAMPIEHRINLEVLYYKLSYLRSHVNMPLVINTRAVKSRGYRTLEQHYNLYEDIMRKTGKMVHIPTKSMHLYGAAADIYDPTRELQKWIREHMKIVEKLDLYMEHFDATPTWVHMQLYAPESGSRFFLP